MDTYTKKINNSGASGSIRVNTRGLSNLLSGAKEKYIARVGILGSKALANHERKETGKLAKGGGHKKGKGNSELTNAEIGLIHEKGSKTKNIPRRSWLEVPLQDHLGQYFNKLGAQTIKSILENQPKKAYVELGLVCEQIILKGFETGGYGKWKPLSSITQARKHSSTILVDTAQLKKSVTSEVVSK